MRYPKDQPWQCTTQESFKTLKDKPGMVYRQVYCFNTRQKLVEGTCKACLEHYHVLSSKSPQTREETQP